MPPPKSAFGRGRDLSRKIPERISKNSFGIFFVITDENAAVFTLCAPLSLASRALRYRRKYRRLFGRLAPQLTELLRYKQTFFIGSLSFAVRKDRVLGVPRDYPDGTRPRHLRAAPRNAVLSSKIRRIFCEFRNCCSIGFPQKRARMSAMSREDIFKTSACESEKLPLSQGTAFIRCPRFRAG